MGLDALPKALGAVLALLLILAPAAAGAVPSIGAPQARPNPFTPDGDGLNDETELSFTPGGAASSVRVQVTVTRVSDQVLLQVPIPSTDLPSGVEVRMPWAPAMPPVDGAYRFDITVSEGADSTFASVEVVADTAAPSVTLGTVGPNPFDPLALPPTNVLKIPVDVQTDSLTDVSTAVSIRRDGDELRALGTFDGAGSSEFRWNGRLADSTIAPFGIYEVFALALDAAGNADSASQSITLDADPPFFRVELPDTLSTTVLPVTISGLAIDEDVVDVILASIDGGPFVAVDSMSAVADTTYFEVELTAPPVPAFHDVVIRAFDAYGHSADYVQVVAFDSVAPMPQSIDVLNSGPVRSGDVITIRTVWNLEDLTVRGDFSDLDTGFRANDGSVPVAQTHDAAFIPEGGGSYLLRYEITPTNSKPSGLREIVVRASTTYLAATDTVFVSLDGRFLADELVSIDRNRFDPRAGDVVTIAAEFGTVPLAVEIFSLSGRRVRFLEGEGFVRWDGITEDGAIAASGVYFLRIKTDEAEEVRKVAVMKGGGS